MKRISFAWTTADLVLGQKTATRRCWDDRHAGRFRAGDEVLAYERSPRAGGKPIAVIRLTRDPYRQPLSAMTEADLAREGTLWSSVAEFCQGFPCAEPWVIEFELVSLTPLGEDIRRRLRPLPGDHPW